MPYVRFDDKSIKESGSKGPLDVNRIHTDLPFLAAFGAFIALWITVAIYAANVDHESDNFYDNLLSYKQVNDFFILVIQHVYSSRYVALGFIAFAAFLLSLLVVLFRWATKVLVWITIVLVSIIKILIYCVILYAMCEEKLNFIYLLPLVIITIIYGMIIYALKKTGINVVCKVIRESCKAIFFFPSTLLFMIAQLGLHLLMICFVTWVYEFLKTVSVSDSTMDAVSADVLSDESWGSFDEPDSKESVTFVPHHIYFFHVANFCGFLWANSFIMGFGRMVLTATFATWYHIQEKRLVPFLTLPKCFARIFCYHLGTLAYGSSLLTIIPMLIVVCKYGHDRLKKMYKRPILILSWLTILTKFSLDALSMCAITGSSFYKSAKDSYILLMKNPVSFLAINTVSECVIFLGLLLVPFLSFLATMGYYMYWYTLLPLRLEIAAALFTVFVTSLVMSLIFFMVFRAAANTIHYCYLQDSKFINESQINLYEIHIDEVSVANEKH